MIAYDRFVLDNGLRVLVHKDDTTPIVAFNVLYDVGARDEHPDRTGFAHLFEHLMFEGSANIPHYDAPLQEAGGENNAFTNNNYTNYYITLPKENLETAFWLESDRMLELGLTQEKLDIQKKVVIEEFNQRYLNQPYGDWNLLLRPLAYKVHPYMWPTIGKNTDHIAEATLADVKDFFYRFYAPNNAILVVAGDVNTDKIKELTQKWFGGIPRREVRERNLPKEPAQTERREQSVERNVPLDAIYMAFHMTHRLDHDYFAADLISDILSNGKSARLTQNLVKEKKLFSSVNAYISGDVEEGLFIVNGNLNEGISFEEAETAIWEELDELKNNPLDGHELEKVKNKVEANLIYSEINVLNKAMSLAYNEMLGNAAMINEETENYQKVSAEQIQRVSAEIFSRNNESVLYYKAQKKQ